MVKSQSRIGDAIESCFISSLVEEANKHGSQPDEGLEDASSSTSELASVVPQSEEGTTQVLYKISSSSTYDTQTPIQDG